MLFKWIQETIALLLLYLLMHQCHVFDMDTFYFSSLNDVNSFRKFCPVSLSRCIYECKIRARCEAINYSKMWKLCSLISGPLITSGDSQIGFVHGRKAEWDMTSYESCYLCGDDEVCNISMDTFVPCQIEECGVPALPEYTIIFGNLYNVGANVCYECQHGYINIGGNTNCSVCSWTGDWTTVDITCSAPTTTPEPTTTTTTTTTMTTTTTTTTPPIVCDNNWIEYEGHCYFRVATGKKWSAARTNCRNLGGYLLEIETAAENTFISNTFPSNDYWIGGNDMAQEGKFVWDSGNALTFKWWRSGEPNGGTGENCMRIDTDTKWRDKGCSNNLNSICEK